MKEFCRLCAKITDSHEIVASISDVEQLIEQKLRACCQWTTENTVQNLPHSVCMDCFDKLEKCWLFSQSVQLAQQSLLEIFGTLELKFITRLLFVFILSKKSFSLKKILLMKPQRIFK